VCAARSRSDEGAPCQGSGDCKSFNCLGGVCRKGGSPDGKGCLGDEECLGGYCNHLGTCGKLVKDAGAPDQAAPDRGTPDAPSADTRPPDSARPDVASPDSVQPDKALPDAMQPDKAQPDQTQPDLTPPDMLQPDASLCGNGKLDPTEICDGSLLGGKTCKTQGFTGGKLQCSGCKLDTLLCFEVRDPGGFKIGAHATVNTLRPRLASDGKGFFVTWVGQKSSWVDGALVDAKGQVASQLKIVNTAPTKESHDVGFGGKDYLVVWDQTSNIFGTTVTTAGVVGSAVGTALVSGLKGVRLPSLAFDGTSFLVAHWLNSGGSSFHRQLWARRVSPGAKPLGSSFQLSKAIVSAVSHQLRSPGMAHDGLNFMVAWSNTKDLIAGRVSSAGLVLNSKDIVVSSGAGVQNNPVAAGGGGGAMVAWEDGQAGGQDINGVGVSQAGVMGKASWINVSTIQKCTPSLAFDGHRFLVVWAEGLYCQGNVRGVRISATGKVVDPAPFDISTAGGKAEYGPAAAFGGGQFLVVWQDQRLTKLQIYGTRLRFGKTP